MNSAVWLVRREFWENRAIWMIPVVIGGLMILAALFGHLDLITLDSPVQGRAFGGIFLIAFGATFYGVMSVYATWYLLDCLYADRKDRSILFWKSLPISDTETVVSKLAVALVVIPLVYFAAADLTTLITAFIISVRASSLVGSSMWHIDAWLQLQVLWLWAIFATAVWYLPVAGWLMVISAWAKRAVMLWSVLPPVALILAERWFLGTRVIAEQLLIRLLGFVPLAFHANPNSEWWATTTVDHNSVRTPASLWSILNCSAFFSSAQTWVGVAVGLALVAGAVQLRMRRTEI
jgi:ABC-2 type transport system permease protein